MAAAKYTMIGLMLLTAMTGCLSNRIQPDRPGLQAAQAAADCAGGMERLARIKTVRATAIVTLFDPDGAARVRAQQIEIRPARKRIYATGQLPSGQWNADVSLDGDAKVDTQGDLQLSTQQKDEIADYLRLILHRFRGPMNLLRGREQPLDAEQVFLATRPLLRVMAKGRENLASAYFFSMEDDCLQIVTQGDCAAGGHGTVTLYGYPQAAADGILLPDRLDVVELGRNCFIGDRKLLSVQLKNITIH